MTSWQITSNTTRTIDDGRRRTVTVNTFAGQVNVMASMPGTTSVHVEVAGVRGPAVRIDDSGNAVLIEHLRAEGTFMETVKEWFNSRGDVASNLTITVPPGTRVSVRSFKAQIVASGLTGTLHVKTGTGPVTLSGLAGDVDVMSGTAPVRAERLSGDIKFKTGSGSLTVTDSAPASVKFMTSSGVTTLDLTGPSLVTGNSGNGNITIHAPAEQGYDITAKSARGHVVADGTTLTGGNDGSRGGHQHEGDRSLAIKVNSVGGNIVLLRGQASTAPGAGPVIVGDERPRSTVQDEIPPRRPGSVPGPEGDDPVAGEQR